MRESVRDIMYARVANTAGLLVSLFVSVVVLRFISSSDYGYWQLYIFYSAYAGFLKLGLRNGIYLRFGGYQYEDLKRHLLHSQIVVLKVLLLCVCAWLRVTGRILSFGAEKSFLLIENFDAVLRFVPARRAFAIHSFDDAAHRERLQDADLSKKWLTVCWSVS